MQVSKPVAHDAGLIAVGHVRAAIVKDLALPLRGFCTISRRLFSRRVWWFASHEHFFPVDHQVSRAVIQALKKANVVLPYTAGSVRVEMNSGET